MLRRKCMQLSTATAPQPHRASATTVDVDGAVAPVEEVDPADGTRGSGQRDPAAARLSREGESPGRGEGLAVPEGDPHVEQLQITTVYHEADVLELALARSPDDVALSVGDHLPLAEGNPLLLNDGRREEQQDRDEGVQHYCRLPPPAPQDDLELPQDLLQARQLLAVARPVARALRLDRAPERLARPAGGFEGGTLGGTGRGGTEGAERGGSGHGVRYPVSSGPS